jgi:hypothetical protein
MGLLTDIANDLQMGFGLKDRNRDYYESTAKSITNQRGEAAGRRYRDRVGLDDGTKLGSKKMPFRGGLLGGMDIDFGEYKNMKDMFDRGGANARGGIFQGGGLLSDIANSLFPPKQTSGFGASSKNFEPLGENDQGLNLKRPWDEDFFSQYMSDWFSNAIPKTMSYNQYYDFKFP